MPAPTNISAGTAILIGSLPYSNTQQVTDSGVCYTVWYKITGLAGKLAIQVLAANDTGTGTYVPDITFYATDGVTEILSPNNLTPIQVGTLTAIDYYIKITPNVTDLSSAILRIDVTSTPTAPIVASYVLINDDGQSGSNVQGKIPGVIINSATGTVSNMVFPLAQGDFGDILPNGIIALENFAVDDLVFYDPDFDVITTVDLSPATDFIRVRAQNTLGQFAVTVRQAGTTKFKVFNDDGTEDSNDDTTLLANPMAIALSNDGGTMYFSLQTGTSPIKTWDMGGNVAGADFAAAVGTSSISDLLVMTNGDVIALHVLTGTSAIFAKRYNSAGVLQTTYTLGTSEYPNGANPRMGYDADAGQTAFWVWSFPTLIASRLRKIQISDGDELITQDIPVYEEGVAQSDYDAGTFGASNSCPIIVLGTNNEVTSNGDGTLVVNATGTILVTKYAGGDIATEFAYEAVGLSPPTFSLTGATTQTYANVVAGSGYGFTETPPDGWIQDSVSVSNGSPIGNITVADGETVTVTFTNSHPVPVPTTYAIRRLRRFPHLSSEQFQQFFSKLQIDIQPGVGLTGTETTQGVDPQIMLRWSDDGGFTWSNEHWVSAGRIGQYSRRAIWRRLGRGRDRVFEVTMTDPVKWVLVDAFLDVTKGTS